jgi:hypothetical protein
MGRTYSEVVGDEKCLQNFSWNTSHEDVTCRTYG